MFVQWHGYTSASVQAQSLTQVTSKGDPHAVVPTAIVRIGDGGWCQDATEARADRGGVSTDPHAVVPTAIAHIGDRGWCQNATEAGADRGRGPTHPHVVVPTAQMRSWNQGASKAESCRSGGCRIPYAVVTAAVVRRSVASTKNAKAAQLLIEVSMFSFSYFFALTG